VSGVTTCLCNDFVSRDTLNTHSKNTVNIYDASSISFLNLTHHEVVPSKGTVWFLCIVPVSIDCLGQSISFGETFRGLPSNYLGAIFKQSMSVRFGDMRDSTEESRLNTALTPILYAGLTIK